jgi:hypothetical protein
MCPPEVLGCRVVVGSSLGDPASFRLTTKQFNSIWIGISKDHLVVKTMRVCMGAVPNSTSRRLPFRQHTTLSLAGNKFTDLAAWRNSALLRVVSRPPCTFHICLLQLSCPRTARIVVAYAVRLHGHGTLSSHSVGSRSGRHCFANSSIVSPSLCCRMPGSWWSCGECHVASAVRLSFGPRSRWVRWKACWA